MARKALRTISWLKGALNASGETTSTGRYALQLDDDLWVIHAFQKKSKSGIATPKHEIDVVRERIKRLKEALS